VPYYYAAFNAIDWNIPGKRIGDRKKPLAEKTMERIKYGLEKYGNQHLLFINLEHSKAKNSSYVKSYTEPLLTQTTSQSTGFVVPFVCELNSTGKARGTYKHLSTILANGNHHLLVGNYSPGWVRGINEQLGTITCSDHHGLLKLPLIVNNRGQSKSMPSINPLGTLTSNINHGILTQENVNAFLASYYSGSMVVSRSTESLRTITTNDRAALVQPHGIDINDCYYRMLKPHEIKLGMAFDKSYIVLGTNKEQVKQLGNAVTPPVMEWLIDRCVKSLN
jgi:DNA (cytosine-5)-methyltransferase 1